MSWPNGDYFVFHTWCKSLSVMHPILGIPLHSMMQWVIHWVQLGILCFQQSTVDHRAGNWWKTSRDLTSCILLQSIWNLCNEMAEKTYEFVLCWLNGSFALHVDWQTPVEDVPLAIAPFQGRVLVGVGKLLRIYDLGKKKLLRKCENKVRPSTYMFVWRCFSLQTLGSRQISLSVPCGHFLVTFFCRSGVVLHHSLRLLGEKSHQVLLLNVLWFKSWCVTVTFLNILFWLLKWSELFICSLHFTLS